MYNYYIYEKRKKEKDDLEQKIKKDKAYNQRKISKK